MAEPTEPGKSPAKELTGRIGKYQIVRLLGRGAMGQVYLAHDTVLERDVALKVMAAQIADDPELKQRFEREARAVAKMTHPNVVTVFDLGSHSDGSPFIAMELLRGQDLQRLMRQGQPLPLDRKVAIIVQVLTGLAHAHHAGIVHRDIKPANIFIQEDGTVKIMDFGVARLTTASMTGTGNIVGTADYMSPEQVQGAKVDGRSDLFSVGCMLFELLSGRRPFHSESLVAIFYKITHEDPGFDLIPRGSDADELLPILRRALAKDAGERFQTAYDFAIALREWLKGHAASAASQQALEALVGLEPMTHPPGLTDPGAAAGATIEIGGRGTGPVSRRTTGATRAVGPTAVTGPSASQRSIPRARRVEPPRRPPGLRWLPWTAGGLVVAAAVAGYLAWRSGTPPFATVPATQASAEPTATPDRQPVATPEIPTASATVESPSAPPATPAPQPTFAPAEGAGAAAYRVAQSAFKVGNYGRAVEAAQQALREDPANGPARSLLDNALAGQRATASVRAAEAALARGDFAAADEQAAAALRLAPWDRSAVDLRSRVEAARVAAQREAEARTQQAQREAAARAQQADRAQISAWLTEANTAMERKQYEAAIAAYNQVLAKDPGNVVAQINKGNAITAQAVAEEVARGGRAAAAPAHAFVAGRTEAKATESGGGPAGFEESAGVVVKRATQAADLPGRIVFEATPSSPKVGDRFGVAVHLQNDGAQPIQLKGMQVATTVNGKTQRGSVPPLTHTVAPRDRGLVFQVRDQTWREGTAAWTMEIVLFTPTGESFRNTLSWK